MNYKSTLLKTLSTDSYSHFLTLAKHTPNNIITYDPTVNPNYDHIKLFNGKTYLAITIS